MRKRVIVACLAVCAAVLGIALLMPRKPFPDNKKSRSTYNVVTVTVDNPSEAPVTAYTADAKDPLSIEIKSVDAKGFIQKVGVDQHKQMAAPNNVNLAGWFVDTVRPGQKGLSIIDGHVDGKTTKGVFYRLEDVAEKDMVEVTMGDGSIKKYEVFKKHTVATDKAAALLYNQDPAVTSQLNLITCAGDFNRESSSYDQRIIIYAKLVQ